MKLQSLKPRIQTVPGRLQQAATLSTQRLRGRAAVDRRARFLRDHPLCEVCERAGLVTEASAADHRIPLWAGGTDDLVTNGNALCGPDHQAKTDCETRMRAAGGWLSTPCTCGQHKSGR